MPSRRGSERVRSPGAAPCPILQVMAGHGLVVPHRHVAPPTGKPRGRPRGVGNHVVARSREILLRPDVSREPRPEPWAEAYVALTDPRVDFYRSARRRGTAPCLLVTSPRRSEMRPVPWYGADPRRRRGPRQPLAVSRRRARAGPPVPHMRSLMRQSSCQPQAVQVVDVDLGAVPVAITTSG